MHRPKGQVTEAAGPSIGWRPLHASPAKHFFFPTWLGSCAVSTSRTELAALGGGALRRLSSSRWWELNPTTLVWRTSVSPQHFTCLAVSDRDLVFLETPRRRRRVRCSSRGSSGNRTHVVTV